MKRDLDVNARQNLVRKTIGGKTVVSFRSHHHALIPWHECRNRLDQAPRLLSIDYHTDSHIPFLRHCFQQGRETCDGREPPRQLTDQLRHKRLKKIILSDPTSIDAAVVDLWHDEHIQTALRSGIIDAAFIIAERLQDELRSDQQIKLDEEYHASKKAGNDDDFLSGTIMVTAAPIAEPPFTYTFPTNKMIILEDSTEYLNEEEYKAWRDKLIESKFLKGRLDLIEEICRTAQVDSLFDRPFILDIDLDAFNTRQSINPADPSIFYEIIRRCEMITIAQEPECVESCQILNEQITADWLESNLLRHIDLALG